MLTSIVILLVVFLALLAVSLLSPRFCPYMPTRQLFSPWNTTLIVWIAMFSFYLTVHDKLYPVSPQFVRAITIWVLAFTLSSVLAFVFVPVGKQTPWTPCDLHVNLLTALSLVVVPMAFVHAVRYAMSMGSPLGLFNALRDQAISPDENQLGVANYFLYVIEALLMIEVSRDKPVKWRLCLIIGMCVIFFLATMAKITFATFVFSCLYLLYERGKISYKAIIGGTALLILLVPLTQILRGDDPDNMSETSSIVDILVIYTVSSIVAFGTITPCSATQWGEMVFRPFYRHLQNLGFNVAPPPESIQDFTLVPYPTNVYTMLAPYYHDFGMTGILAFALIEGAALGILYKYAKMGNNLTRYVYAYIFTMLAIQFFDEQFFLGMPNIILVTLVLVFCHVRVNYHKKGA